MKHRPHRAGKRRNACPATGKVRYSDRQSALQVIHGAQSGIGRTDGYVPIRAYECPACAG